MDHNIFQGIQYTLQVSSLKRLKLNQCPAGENRRCNKLEYAYLCIYYLNDEHYDDNICIKLIHNTKPISSWSGLNRSISGLLSSMLPLQHQEFVINVKLLPHSCPGGGPLPPPPHSADFIFHGIFYLLESNSNGATATHPFFKYSPLIYVVLFATMYLDWWAKNKRMYPVLTRGLFFLFNNTYRLFSEYSAMLQYFWKYTVVIEYKNIRRCVNLLLKKGYWFIFNMQSGISFLMSIPVY
jgi:hypothetical protein